VANIKSQINVTSRTISVVCATVFIAAPPHRCQECRAAIDSGCPNRKLPCQCHQRLDKAAEQVLFTEIMPPPQEPPGKSFAKMEPAKVETAMVEPVVVAEPKRLHHAARCQSGSQDRIRLEFNN